uniref:Protein yellow-like n=1 Tax=Diabrotica virgifera virgifera TaxID=50390 RepID=A0A6P7FHE7_DIAVI
MRRYYSHYSLLLLSLFFAAANSERFRVIREWKYINFTWPNADVYDNALSRGFYVPENIIISGIKFFEDYYYITLPRMKDGVPATLARIPAGPTAVTAPAFEPFPSWEMNAEGDCNAFQNVQNIEIDPKGQMWIIDSGRTETLTSPSSRCPPKLVIFDIKKNMTTTAYTFPDNVASLNSNFLYDIVVDDTDSGFAYITDNSAKDPGIIIFSVKDHHSWKIRHSESMRADPTATTFRVNGVIINSPLNLASISLSPRVLTTSEGKLVVDDDREVFYSPISSLKMYSINTTVLKNEQNGANNGEYQGNVNTIGIKGSQSAGNT